MSGEWPETLGEIPEGWEVGSLADFALLNPETWSKKTRPNVISAVGPLLKKSAGNEHESRTLAALRDSLLPKLISGELRVKDAEKLIGRIV